MHDLIPVLPPEAEASSHIITVLVDEHLRWERQAKALSYGFPSKAGVFPIKYDN